MHQDPIAIMLFAAGFGTRMGALTQHCPKPLIKVAGKALLDHTLELAQEIEPARIVVNTHYLGEQIAQHLSGTQVTLSPEQPEILDTGGGLRHALPQLGPGPVFTGNTDAIWRGPNPFALLRDAWRPEDMDALMLCVAPENVIGHRGAGDFLIDGDDRLTRGPGAVYGGIQILRTEGLTRIDKAAFSLNLLWDEMLARGRLFGLTYPGKWCDVGSPEGIALAEDLLEADDV